MNNLEKLKQTILDTAKKIDADILKQDLESMANAIVNRFNLIEKEPREYWICPRCLVLYLHQPILPCTCNNLTSVDCILLREVR